MAIRILGYSLIGLCLGGCSWPSRQVKVVKSAAEIQILRLDIEDGDVIACDPSICRVVKK